MDIYLIWATDGDAIWLVGAWDDDSVAENGAGYREEVERHRKDHGHDNVRVVLASIDFAAVTRTFQVPSIGAMTVAADQDAGQEVERLRAGTETAQKAIEGTMSDMGVVETAAGAEAQRRYRKGVATGPLDEQRAFVAGALWHRARGGDFEKALPDPSRTGSRAGQS